jgi:hypothetical protein
MDFHHRCLDTDAGHNAVQGALEYAVVEADIGGRSAHVKSDQPLSAGGQGCLDHSDDAGSRSRQDTVLASEVPRLSQPAVALHE